MNEHRALTPLPLDRAMDVLTGAEPGRVVTMSEGQWDALLSAAYDADWTLLELDAEERPVRAYRLRNVEKDAGGEQ